MNVSLLDRLSPLSGIVGFVLLVWGMVLVGRMDYFPSPERAAELFTVNPGRTQLGALIAGFYGVVFFLWFVGSLFARLSQGTEKSFASALVLMGGLILAVGLMLANGFIWVAADRAGRSGMSPESAVIFYDLTQVLLANVVSIGFAVLIGGAGIGAMQSNVLPMWLAWVSIVMAIGLLTPIHYIFEALSIIWVVVVSILLYVKQ